MASEAVLEAAYTSCANFNAMVQYPYAVFSHGTAVWLGDADRKKDEAHVRQATTAFLKAHYAKAVADVIPTDEGYLVENYNLMNPNGLGSASCIYVFVSQAEASQHGLGSDDDKIAKYAEQKRHKDAADPLIKKVHTQN